MADSKQGFAAYCPLTLAAGRTARQLDNYFAGDDPGDVLGWDEKRRALAPVRLERPKPAAKMPLIEMVTTRRQRLVGTGTVRVLTSTGDKELQALKPHEDRVFVLDGDRVIKAQVASVRPVEPGPAYDPIPRRELPVIFVGGVLVRPIP